MGSPKKLGYQSVLSLILTCFLMVSCTQTAEFKAQMKKPNTVLYLYDLLPSHNIDLGNAREVARAYDEAQVVATLQGNVNRQKPQLYTTFVRYNGKSVDEFWLNKLRERDAWLEHATLVRVENMEALLARFRRQVEGVVVWDPSVPATSNVASTVAGAENLIAVRYDPSPDSLYTLITKKLRMPVKQWLINHDGSSLFTGEGLIPGTKLASSGSAKNDAYLWAKVNYLDTGKSNPNVLAYYLDAYWLQDPQAIQLHVLVNHDYLVSQRGFAFDLSPWADETPVDDPTQPLGTDRETMEAILRSAYEQTGGDTMTKITGFVPWAFKYTTHGNAGGMHDPVPGEWKFVEIASAYNAYVEADAHSLDAMANASVFQHFPLQEVYEQPDPPTREELQARGYLDAEGRLVPKNYVAYYGGDYDSPTWLYQNIPFIWGDEARGKLPISWAFNPNLADRAAPVMDFVRRTATETDVFIAGDSGAGYVNPGLLEEPRPYSGLPSGMDTWVTHNQRYYRQWDLSATGFIINGFARGLSDEGWQRYAEFSPDGIGANSLLPGYSGVKDGVPYIIVGDVSFDRGVSAAADSMAALMNLVPFYMFRSILRSPSELLAATNELRERVPNVEVVDALTLFQLIAFDHEAQLSADYSQEASVYVRTTQPLETFGLNLVPQIDGPVEFVQIDGESVLRLKPNPFGPVNFLYVGVHDTFLFDAAVPATVVVEYLDKGTGSFTLEYDGADPTAGALEGAYTPSEITVQLQDTGSWQEASFPLEGVRFANRQNGGSDFRLVGIDQLPLTLRSIEVRR